MPVFKKGAFTFILAVLIIMGLTATSFANPGKGNAGWKFNGKGNGKVVQFNDIGSHWAAQTIREMNRLGITSGYPDYSFKPNAPVSRYEALLMICRADGFDPVEGQSWEDRLEDCLEYAVDHDIIEDDENFAGWKPAKRYEVAVWAMRAKGDLDIDDEGLPFLDTNDIPEDARHYIGVMFKHKWMVGYPDKKFQPNKPVTRAELTVIIYRMLDDVWPDYDNGDISALRVKSLDPKDGENNVDTDTDELVATFNMDIAAVDDLNDVEAGIVVRNVTEDEDVDIDNVVIDGRELIIDLGESLDEDMRYRVTIDDGIIESEDGEEEFDGLSGSDWEFFTYDVDEEEISLDSLDPEDGDDEVVPSTDELRATFDNDISFINEDLKNAVRVYNVDEEAYVDIDKIEIDGDTLVITLEEELGADDTFRVTIKPGYIEDEDTGADYGGLGGNEWSFTTAE
jgi:Bacterial Ig-like domain/S-layer homology domain